jgi:hypothetical protein
MFFPMFAPSPNKRMALLPYEETCRQASFVPQLPQILQLRVALRGNQTATDQFYGMALGTVPAAAFYAPDNMQRILTSAA